MLRAPKRSAEEEPVGDDHAHDAAALGEDEGRQGGEDDEVGDVEAEGDQSQLRDDEERDHAAETAAREA